MPAEQTLGAEERRETFPEGLEPDCGRHLAPLDIAWTYGPVNNEKSNVILVRHAWTGDPLAADQHPVTCKPGWRQLGNRQGMTGEGLPSDTNRSCVIRSNCPGGCRGATGPACKNPDTGKPCNLSLPAVAVPDAARARAMPPDQPGIDNRFRVIGGSMGGMQALQRVAACPERVFGAVPIAAAARRSARNIAFHPVGRQALRPDPRWHGGGCSESGIPTKEGLAVVRMLAHVTCPGERKPHRGFDRNRTKPERVTDFVTP